MADTPCRHCWRKLAQTSKQQCHADWCPEPQSYSCIRHQMDSLRSNLTALYTALGVSSQREAIAAIGRLREYTGGDAVDK